MDSDSVRGIDRRRLLGLAGAGVVAAGVSLSGDQPSRADPATSEPDRIPPDTRPGGAYDRYVAKLAAEDKFSGVVLLSHRGRTVLSRSYGMADKEKGIRNHEGVAFNLYGGPFVSLSIVQLAQQGKVKLWDTVGTYLTGFASEIAEQVRIHHLLVGTSGLSFPGHHYERVFHSKEEQHEYHQQYTRQATLLVAPGAGSNKPGWGSDIVVQIVEAVTGMTFWDYVNRHIFGRCGMTGSAYCTRPQWLSDEHIAHSYMKQADGSRVDAVRNLDKDSPSEGMAGQNNARNFVPHGGFVTAPDMARFAEALYDGTVLDPVWADVFTSIKAPNFRGSLGSPPTARQPTSSKASGSSRAAASTPAAPPTGASTRTPGGPASFSATTTTYRCGRSSDSRRGPSPGLHPATEAAADARSTRSSFARVPHPCRKAHQSGARRRDVVDRHHLAPSGQHQVVVRRDDEHGALLGQ